MCIRDSRKAHGMIAEKPNSIYQKGGYTKKDVEKNILSNPFKRFEDMRFLMRCKDVETVEVNPIIFRKLTREDWLHIVDVCDKSLEKYVTLNEQKLDLNPPKAEVEKDVELFLRYMDGYEKFHGDHIGMQFRYYEFANWFFCSPFMACMRDMAVRYNQNTLPYPVFGLVYGQSKAGKTSFLETLLKMMIGQKTKISAPDFTRSSIDSLKQTVHGAPIIVDDLTNTRFNQHAIETIKNDDFGIAEHLVNYPAVVISANEDVKAVAPEVIRRTVICRVQAGLTNTEVMSMPSASKPTNTFSSPPKPMEVASTAAPMNLPSLVAGYTAYWTPVSYTHL